MTSIRERHRAYQLAKAVTGPLKTSRLRLAFLNQATAKPLLAGGQVDWAGASVKSGDEYWGVAGANLPMSLAPFDTSGEFRLPHEDSVYALELKCLVQAGVGDVGKTIGLNYHGWASDTDWQATVNSLGQAFFSVNAVDYTHPGDAVFSPYAFWRVGSNSIPLESMQILNANLTVRA